MVKKPLSSIEQYLLYFRWRKIEFYSISRGRIYFVWCIFGK